MAFAQSQKRARELGIQIGLMPTGKFNAITDVEGVEVGHTSVVDGQQVRTGVTAILPHDGNLFQEKVPAAIFVGNGFGKLAGSTQVQELGNLETPIILTNTLNVAQAVDAIVQYTLEQPGNEHVKSVNALVGETNDSFLNDIRGRHVTQKHVLDALKNAKSGPVEEGSIGAGSGTMCFGFKGGIGTASRKLPASLGGFNVGVLVQSNFGGALQIDGVPIGAALQQFDFSDQLLDNVDGSCMIIVATDAPLDSRNLERLAKRAFMGLAKTGGIASNGSGDYVIAFSTDSNLRIHPLPSKQVQKHEVLANEQLSPLFMAAIEATEEAIINSLFKAETVSGYNGNTGKQLPIDQVLKIMSKHQRIQQ